MRDDNNESLMWIDAWYINQLDVEEYNYEVPKMRERFSQSSRLHIWLGRFHEASDPFPNNTSDKLKPIL
jgi:hypothetical protein